METAREQVARLGHPPVPGREHLGRRPGLRQRRPGRLPRPAVDDDVLQRPPVADVLRLRPRGEGPRHPSRRHPGPRSTTSPRSRRGWPHEKATVDEKLAEAKELLSRLEAEERERMMASRSSTARLPDVAASGQRRRRRPVRDGPGRRRLRLRRRRARRLRLLRPDDGGLGRSRRRPAALVQRPVRLRARTRRQRAAAG